MIRMRVYSRCMRGCICVPDRHFRFCFFLLCLLLLPYHVLCITPSLKLSSSLLCGNHGTTAAAHKVCVDHYLLPGMRVCDVCDTRYVYDTSTSGMCYCCNFKVNDIVLSRSSCWPLLFSLNNTAAHASCFLQSRCILHPTSHSCAAPSAGGAATRRPVSPSVHPSPLTHG